MKATRMAAILAASCLIPTAVSAQDADFTFTVPVEVELLHPNLITPHAPQVYCQVLTNTNAVVRAGWQAIPVDAQGSYSGDVVVELDTEYNDIPVSDATQYRCGFLFRLGGTGVAKTSIDNSYPTGVGDILQPKVGTSPTLLVEGTL